MDRAHEELYFRRQLQMASSDEVDALAYLLFVQNRDAMDQLERKDQEIETRNREKWEIVEKLAEKTRIVDRMTQKVEQLEAVVEEVEAAKEAVTAKYDENKDRINQMMIRHGIFKQATDEVATALRNENERLNGEVKKFYDGTVELGKCLKQEKTANNELEVALKLTKKREAGIKSEGGRLRMELNKHIAKDLKLSQQKLTEFFKDHCENEKCKSNKSLLHKTIGRLSHQTNRLEAVAHFFADILKQYNLGTIDYSRVSDGMYALYKAPGANSVALTNMCLIECGRNKDGVNSFRTAASTCGSNPTSQSVNPCQPTINNLVEKCKNLAGYKDNKSYKAVTATIRENGDEKEIMVKNNFKETRKQMDQRYGKKNNAHEVLIKKVPFPKPVPTVTVA